MYSGYLRNSKAITWRKNNGENILVFRDSGDDRLTAEQKEFLRKTLNLWHLI